MVAKGESEPEEGAEEDEGAVCQAAEVAVLVEGRALHVPCGPVAEQVRFAYPEHGDREYRIPPDGDEQAGDRLFQEGGGERNNGQQQQE